MPESTVLCGVKGKRTAVTVAKYRAWCAQADEGWSKKPAFIQRRLNERYIAPIRRMKIETKNGFLIMAVCCLLIETLESFYQGHEDTKGASGTIFKDFFANHARFRAIHDAGLSKSFFEDVRCGILHQGETKGGWTISRSPSCPMFVPGNCADGPKLNATLFHNELSRQIRDYARDLSHPRDSNLRNNFDAKMKRILENCK